jgi:NAD(P)H-flavin reductase
MDPITKLADKPLENPYQPKLANIIRIVPQAVDNYLFQVRFASETENLHFDYRPGQFNMVSVLGVGEMPISISSTPTRRGFLEMCIRRVGRVTEAFYKLREGDLIGIRGPYGNGFPVEKLLGSNLLLVAGGLGMVPLRSLLNYAIDRRDEFGDIILMYGTKTPVDFLFREELEYLTQRVDAKVMLIVEESNGDTSEKPWKGEVGMVTQLFDDLVIDPKTTFACVCGPPVMYRFVIRKLLEKKFSKNRILINLERRMKCGVGKCAHCSIGYKYTCIDGPVFTYWDAINLPEMI